MCSRVVQESRSFLLLWRIPFYAFKGSVRLTDCMCATAGTRVVVARRRSLRLRIVPPASSNFFSILGTEEMLHLPPCRAVVAAVEASWNFQVAMPVLVQKLLELLSSLSNFSYFTQDLCFNKWLKVGGRRTLTESFSSNKKQELMYVTNYKGHLLDSRSIHFFVAKNFVLQCNILEFQLVCSFHIQ